jgi:hypothetical protein
MAARKNGSKTRAGFVSGITGGLRLMMLEVVDEAAWAMLGLLKVEAPAKIKTVAPNANALRSLFRKLEKFIIASSIVGIMQE